MVPVLEKKIRLLTESSTDGKFYLNKAFKDFYINGKYCPPYERSTSRLVMQYHDSIADASLVRAKLIL